jgi:hypothetical protein
VRPRVIRRPIGGWGARQWRRDVGYWLLEAFVFLASGASCALIFAICQTLFA